MKELIEKLEKLKEDYRSDFLFKESGYKEAIDDAIILVHEAIQALSQSEGESIIKEIERRLLIVKSEPNGIVRETMLDDLLINLTPPQTK